MIQKEIHTSKLCRLGVGQCSNSRTQKFKLSWHIDIRYSETSCFDVSLGGNEAPINFYQCHGGQGNQLWRYEKVWFFRLCTAANSLISRQFSCLFVLLSVIKSKVNHNSDSDQSSWLFLDSRLAFFRWMSSSCQTVIWQLSSSRQIVILSLIAQPMGLKDFSFLFPLFNLNCLTISFIYIFWKYIMGTS